MNNRERGLKMDIEGLLQGVRESKASDLHITAGMPPTLRISGQLVQMDKPKLTDEDTKVIAYQLLHEVKQFTAVLEEQGEVDFSYEVDTIGRFRVNVFKQRGSYAATLRAININIPTMEELGLPRDILESLTNKLGGLVLVTGPTGSGKSTTLASIIDTINEKKQKHILTLEDPIEYLHKHKNSIVNQREIGIDSKSYAQALRAALREDPDVILVGEMRDLETISTAVTAAETGHLVLSTLHTAGAAQTIDRMIDVFPPHQQQQIKMQLSNIIRGVISQQLLPKEEVRGRCVALEIMIVNPAIANLIREGKTHQLYSHIQTGSQSGMTTMDISLAKLYTQGKISLETATHHAHMRDEFKRLVGCY